MRKILIITTLFFASFAKFAFGGEEERVKHYNSEKPENIVNAIEIFDKNISQIKNILKKQKIDDYDMEDIHEITYNMESSVDFIKEKPQFSKNKIISKLDDAVQNLHHASEDRKKAEVKIWFGKVKANFKKVKKLVTK